MHALVADRLGRSRRAVARGVVDDDDAVDELGDPADRLADEPLLVERGHDDRDPLAVEHQAVGGAAPRRRAAIGSTTSAAIAPRIRPMSAPTSSDERLERAVVLLAAAGSTTRLDSTLSREIEELTRLGEALLDRGAAGVGRRDHGVEVRGHQQPLIERDRAIGEDGRLLRLGRADARVHLVELRLGRLDLLLEQRDLLRDVDRDTLGHAAGERGRSQLDLALARALDRDLHQRVDAAQLAGGEELARRDRRAQPRDRDAARRPTRASAPPRSG